MRYEPMAITPYKLLQKRAFDAGVVLEAMREGGPGGYRYEIRRSYRSRVLATYHDCEQVQAWLAGYLAGMDQDFKAFLSSERR